VSRPGPEPVVSVADLEAVAALGWRATDTERLGDWQLRAAGGFTGRANSVLALGDPGRELDDAVAAVTAWYSARDLPPCFQLPLPDAAPVERHLDAHGWRLGHVVRVLVSPLGPLTSAGPAEPSDGARLRIDPVPDDGWLATYHYRGGTLPAHARAVIGRGDLLGFASVRSPGGDVLAIARGSVDPAPDGSRWLGLTAVEVEPAARRRGLGWLVLRALAGWAAGHGAAACYLQVAADNDPALAMYAGAGFAEHHTYVYRLG